MNKKILSRELQNDAVGIILKYYSLISATSGQSALRAEFYRTILDAFNHFILTIANFMDNKSSNNKLKKVLLFIPAFLFIGIGIYTIYDLNILINLGQLQQEVHSFSFIPIMVKQQVIYNDYYG